MKLFLKLLRDIRNTLGQFIAVSAVSAIGVALLTGFAVTSRSMNAMTGDYYGRANLAAMSASCLGADDAGVAKVKAVPGVADAYGRLTLKASTPDNSKDFLIHSVSADEPIDAPELDSGRLPQGAGECMLDDAYAKANNLATGSKVSAVISGKMLEFSVVGTFDTAEYIYLVENPAKDPVPDHHAFGLLYVDKTAISALAGKQVYNEVLVSLKPGADAQTVSRGVESALKGYGFGHITLQKDQLSYSQLQSDLDTVAAIADSFPYIFFLVAAAILTINMSRTVQAERSQIGVMKALGIREPAILTHYTGYALASGILGGLLGNLLGILAIPPFMLGMYSSLYTFPRTVLSGFGLYAALSTAVVLLFGAAASVLSVRKALRETPAQCMRPAPPRKARKILLERNEKLWKRIPYKNKLILRNILLNKQRAVLSSLGIIGCVGVLLCGFGLRQAASDLYNTQFNEMQRFDDMVQLSAPAPYGSPAPFPMDNVAVADSYSAVPITVGLNAGVNADLYLLPAGSQSLRLRDISGNPLELPSEGVLMPYKLAEQYHVKVGDTVTLKLESTLYKNAQITARVAGVAVQYLAQDVYASYDAVRALGVQPLVNGYYVTAKDASKPSIQGTPTGVKAVVSKSNLKTTVESLMSMMDTFFLLMTAMSAALALAVIFNISSINIFERRRDIATLKVLGYRRREINSLVRTENFFITAFGSLVGIGFGAVIYKYLLIITVNQDMFLPYRITWSMVAFSVLLAFAFTALTNWTLGGKTRRIDMVESLKGVE